MLSTLVNSFFNVIVLVILLTSGNSSSAWPWISALNTMKAELSYSQSSSNTKFGDGTQGGISKGDKIDIFVDTPGKINVKSIQGNLLYIPVKNWQTGIQTGYTRVEWDRISGSSKTGIGDTYILSKVKLPVKIPLAFITSVKIPTGFASNNANQASVGSGNWSVKAGLTTGEKILHSLYIYTTQSYVYAFPRKVGGGTFRRGSAWSGNISTLWAMHYSWLSLSSDWHTSQKAELEVDKVRFQPGIRWVNVKTAAGIKVGTTGFSIAAIFPVSGVEIPTGTIFNLGLTHSFQIFN